MRVVKNKIDFDHEKYIIYQFTTSWRVKRKQLLFCPIYMTGCREMKKTNQL